MTQQAHDSLQLDLLQRQAAIRQSQMERRAQVVLHEQLCAPHLHSKRQCSKQAPPFTAMTHQLQQLLVFQPGQTPPHREAMMK